MIEDLYRLSTEMALAALDGQRVIALRALRLAEGGKKAEREARRMFVEKYIASAEAITSLSQGRSPRSVVKRYRTIMRANEKRLRRAS